MTTAKKATPESTSTKVGGNSSAATEHASRVEIVKAAAAAGALPVSAIRKLMSHSIEIPEKYLRSSRPKLT